MTDWTKQFCIVLLAGMILVGVGCDSAEVSDLTAEEAAASLSLVSGDEIVLRPTVLGLGGGLVDWLGGDSNDRVITINEWLTGEHVGVSWTITTEVETEDSIAARDAYDQEYAETPIGEEIPDSPEVEYEEVVRSGSISSTSMSDARKLMLPDLWLEGDAGDQEDMSLIWLSSAQYDELVNTRSTQLSLGLFDESLQQYEELTETVESYWDRINTFVSEITGNDDSTVEDVDDEDEGSVTDIEADGDWGEYTLKVDGVRTTVRTIEARNNFGSYTILANPDDPLLLEVKLTPLAEGSLDALSPSNLGESFSGYEVSQINKTSAE